MNPFGILTFPVSFPLALLRSVQELTAEVRALRLAVEAAPGAPAAAPAPRRTAAKAPETDVMLPGMTA